MSVTRTSSSAVLWSARVVVGVLGVFVLLVFVVARIGLCGLLRVPWCADGDVEWDSAVALGACASSGTVPGAATRHGPGVRSRRG